MTATLPRMISFAAFTRLRDSLAGYGIETHPSITKGIDIYAALEAAGQIEPVQILELTPMQAQERAVDVSQRGGGAILNPQFSRTIDSMQGSLAVEMRAVVHADMPRLVQELRTVFDKAAAGLYAALDCGIVAGFSAELVLELSSPKAVKAWRELDQHSETLRSIYFLMRMLSEELHVPPQRDWHEAGQLDYTAFFTAPETGIVSGLHDKIPGNNSNHVWLHLAEITGRKLRLNSPEEVRQMKNAALAEWRRKNPISA